MVQEREQVTRLPRRDENFSEWYTQVALRAELAD